MWFSIMTNPATNTCPTRINIGMIIDGDDSFELLQKIYPFSSY